MSFSNYVPFYLSKESRNPLVMQSYITLFEMQIKSIIYENIDMFLEKKAIATSVEVQWPSKSSLIFFIARFYIKTY